MLPDTPMSVDKIRERYPEKFQTEKKTFSNIRRGASLFISSACGEPQYAISALKRYVENNPGAFVDTEVFQVWTMGVAPYVDVKYKDQFRHNAFFIGMNARDAVNEGLADYSPVFLSQVPDLFRRRLVPIDVAIIQTSPPDEHGYVSLGVSVDITPAAIESASIIIAQINSYMPRVHGDSFINIRDIDFVIEHNEPLLDFGRSPSDEIAKSIGKYAARIINDGDTIQVGYGSVPNAIMNALSEKKDLGLHTELLTDGIVDLMKKGVINNSRKTLFPGKAIATFCMGSADTYDYIHDNPAIEFRRIEYVNSPLTIAKNNNMTAINSALQIDLTGQATAESIGPIFFSGIGGSADFMRGALLAPGGKTILLIQSTARDGEISRIVPFLESGTGVTLGRGDVHYVVTEYGIAYLHGKNIRERAMDLIAIAHPKFRSWLIDEAKRLKLIYKDQAFIPGVKGEYPESFETSVRTKSGLDLLLRPVKISDEPKLKSLYYSLSETSMYRRFISPVLDMPHEKLQKITIIDYTKEMVIVATIKEGKKERFVGMGQYLLYENTNTAEVAFVVREEFQGNGIGTELMKHLTYLAVRQGLMGFTAEVVRENRAMLHVFEKMDFEIEKTIESNVCELFMKFKT